MMVGVGISPVRLAVMNFPKGVVGGPTSQGPNDPTVQASVPPAGPAIAWNITGQGALALDSDYCTSGDGVNSLTIEENGNSEELHLKGFGFAIPGGATITGIKVELSRHYTDPLSSGGEIQTLYAQLLKAGAVVGSNRASDAAVWPITTDAYATFGGPGQLWGTTWTPAEINAAGFGFMLQASNPNGDFGPAVAYVNHVRITVYYTT